MMAALSADQGWLEINIEGPHPPFGVYQVHGREKLNEPYEFEVELVAKDPAVDLIGLLGRKALLTMADHSGLNRPVHGLIREAVQLHSANAFTHYRILLVPRLWFLGRNRNHRVFQNKTAPQIIEAVLAEQRFLTDDYKFELKEKYEEREYCVQYGESDLYFISRLCEEEGLYFYFRHGADSHALCFSDASGGPAISGESLLRFHPGSGQAADAAVIRRLNLHSRINSDKAAYREWNFEKPALDLEVSAEEGDARRAPVPEALNLEMYQYPHLYQMKKAGDAYADIQLGRQLALALRAEGEGDVSRLLPGFAFNLHGHPKAEANVEWWLTEVSHFGRQPQVLEHEAPEEGFVYQSRFTAIPFETRFVPETAHPKIRIAGQQTATVTGPESEEIYPDKYGRVKVEFHWDRRDMNSDRSSCWVRVSQGWAGGQYGAMAIPRVGHEVMVGFLEGDPDRPIITGRVYNGEAMPPYELPEHKTRTVFKSLSSPKGGGFNELRVEDKKGEEEIYLHAEKDVGLYVKNDWKETLLHDRHQTVKNSAYVKTEAETHEILVGPRKSELRADDHLTVNGDGHAGYGGRWLVKSGDEIHLAAGSKVVIEAGTELTIKAGDSFVKLDPSGVKIEGAAVKINSGASPADGSGAEPQLPEEAALVPAGAVPAGSRAGAAPADEEPPPAGAGGRGGEAAAAEAEAEAEESQAPAEMACTCRHAAAAGLPCVEIA